MRFVVDGMVVDADAGLVRWALARLVPEAVEVHGVLVDGRVFPVKQAWEAASGLDRSRFTSQLARRNLSRLGLEVLGAADQLVHDSVAPDRVVPAAGPPWPWEGAVQAVFADALRGSGWTVQGLADTATRQHGVDVLAGNGRRALGAEVKGWPSEHYADPRRSQERKPTSPSTQAGHWFAQALMKALMLLDSHPDHESLVVVPEKTRYRDLAARTSTGRRAAGVHVAFVEEDGSVTSDTWAL